MPAALAERFQVARRRLARVLWVRGLAWLTAGMLLTVLTVGVADWLFHFSAELRLLFALALVGLMGWLAYRYLYQPLHVPIDDLVLARHMERLHPQLGEELTATVAFLRRDENDPHAGSPFFRQQIVHRTMQVLDSLNWSGLVRAEVTRPIRRAALVLLLVAGLCVAWSPLSARIALARLVNPYGGPAWPTRTELVIVSPPKQIALGDPLQLKVQAVGQEPDAVRMQYRFAPDQEPANEPLRPTVQGEYRGGLSAVTTPIEFRVAGGDYVSPWHFVEVVPAPEIDKLQLTVSYPAYTGLAAEVMPTGRGRVQAVVGSSIAVEATATKPLADAHVLLQPLAANADGDELPAVKVAANVDPSGLITSQLAVDESFNYRLLVRDTEGMSNALRTPKEYSVEAVPDRAPAVRLESPQGDAEVTATATVPLQLLVKDDFGLGAIRLVNTVFRAAGGESTTETIDLANAERATQYTVSSPWVLETLSLAEGDTLRFRVEALDHRDNPRAALPADRGPNIGSSQEVTLRVVSERDLLAGIEGEQRKIREDIQQLLELQRQAVERVRQVQNVADHFPKLPDEELRRLQAAEAIQRRIREQLDLSRDSLRARVDSLQQRVDANAIKDVTTRRRLTMISTELKRVAQQHLPTISQALTDARKSAQAPPDEKPSPVAKDLREAGDQQDQVITALSQVLQQLEEWDAVGEIASEARQLAQRQGDAEQATQKLLDQTLGRSLEHLTAEEKAALANAGQRQAAVRDELLRLQGKLQRLAEDRKDSDPTTADMLKEALQRSQQQDLRGQMDQAGQDIEKNRLGQAVQQQKQIAEKLDDVAAALENRREQEMLRLVKQLKEAEQAINELRQEQERLRKETAAARQMAQSANPAEAQQGQEELKRLQRRQRELQQKAEEMARRLSRLRAGAASQRSGRAANRMEQAAEKIPNNPDDADRLQDEAMAELEQAQQDIEEQRRDAENELAEEQLAKVEQTIRQLNERQQEVVAEIDRLRALQVQSGRLSRGQLQSVLTLSRTQDGLATETEGLIEKLSAARVFVMALELAIGEMQEASDGLSKRKVDDPVRQSALAAADRIGSLVEALQRDPTDPNEQQQANNNGGGGGQGGAQPPPQDGIPNIAQLKLLKLMQVELLTATRALLAERKNGQFTPAQQEQLADLSKQQGQMADMIRDMVPAKPNEDAEP